MLGYDPVLHGVGFSPPDTIHDVPVDFYCTDWWKSFNTTVAGYPILSTLHPQATKGNYGVEVRYTVVWMACNLEKEKIGGYSPRV